MPWYWRRNYRWRYRPRRQRRRIFRYNRPWRFRKTVLRRPRRWRRRHWVRKRLYRKKLKNIKIRQWQPTKIRKCTVKGLKCLFQAGHGRFANNYGQYQLTLVPEKYPGGGGWSLLVFSLTALWEEFEHLNNWWTASNKGLPLVRYHGASLKFYRNDETDYVVTIRRCFPMTDTPLTHPNSHPQRMLMAHKKILVQSKKTQPKGRHYKKVWVPPPAQMLNKWYFQQDICRTNFLMLTTTAVSLDSYYLSHLSESNNITIYCLNAHTFQHKGFQEYSKTTGYSPKSNTYLYATKNGHDDPYVKELVFLGQTTIFSMGKTYEESKVNSVTNYNYTYWGNPFHPDYLMLNYRVYKSTTQYTNLFTTANLDKQLSHADIQKLLTPTEEPFITECRYAPNKDTGAGNIVYFLGNYREDKGINPPGDKNIQIEGFPLYISLWGWPDWQKKLNYIHRIDSDWFITIQTQFLEPKMQYYIPLDWSFTQGNGPYNTPKENLTLSMKTNWYPKFLFQQLSIDEIANSGPGTCKAESTRSIQAQLYYKFKFSWGGCPAPMQDLIDPCSQPKWTAPDQLLQSLQIQNPETPPETEIHDFDERRQTLTKKAIKRIQDYTTTEGTLFSDSKRSRSDPPIQQAETDPSETSSEEETQETPLEIQIQHQRQQQLRLKHKLKRLVSKLTNIE
nr:MAG: ORF1 [TTV-like mini virus]